MGEPAVAVVIATLARPDAALAVIDDVLGQARPDTEIVVVDQSDRQEHEALRSALAARGDPRIRLLHRTQRSLPGARNVGVWHTRAPIVWFLDDDTRLHAGALGAHVAAFVDPCVGGVVGRIVEHRLRPNQATTTNRIGRGGRILTRLDGPHAIDIETLKGANMSVRRVALLQAGPFDERYGGTALLEDADLSTRIAALGWRLRYEPDAAVDHLHLGAGGVRADTDSEGPPIALRSRFRNTAYFVRRHRGRVAALNVVPTFLALAVVRSWRAGHPGWVPGLVAAFTAGWREAADTPPLRGIE